MDPREKESLMLERCEAGARGRVQAADDQAEANVFRVAAMVLETWFPDESKRLDQASSAYFVTHPSDRVSVSSVIQQGWIISLPRLRDMLGLQLRRQF
jgi:hypothetical protein